MLIEKLKGFFQHSSKENDFNKQLGETIIQEIYFKQLQSVEFLFKIFFESNKNKVCDQKVITKLQNVLEGESTKILEIAERKYLKNIHLLQTASSFNEKDINSLKFNLEAIESKLKSLNQQLLKKAENLGLIISNKSLELVQPTQDQIEENFFNKSTLIDLEYEVFRKIANLKARVIKEIEIKKLPLELTKVFNQNKHKYLDALEELRNLEALEGLEKLKYLNYLDNIEGLIGLDDKDTDIDIESLHLNLQDRVTKIIHLSSSKSAWIKAKKFAWYTPAAGEQEMAKIEEEITTLKKQMQEIHYTLVRAKCQKAFHEFKETALEFISVLNTRLEKTDYDKILRAPEVHKRKRIQQEEEALNINRKKFDGV